MTDAKALLELAERCEKASGADRAIDGDIAEALKLNPPWAPNRVGARQPELFKDDGPGLHAKTWLADRYTASLDAAMGLVPEGWSVERSGWQSIVAPYHAGFELWQYRQNADGEWRHGSAEAIAKGSAVTPALALTAACLRARAL